MKQKIIATIFIVILSMSCKKLYKQPYIHIEPQFAEVHFERPMSRIQLEQLRNDLAAIQIQINYTDIKYDGELLNFLAFTLDYKGQQAEGSTHFVHKVRPYGFIIDDRNNGTLRYVVGELAP